MSLIKLVTNGSNSVQFKAMSLGHVVTVVFGLLTVIVAQQTWLWSGAHERQLIVTTIRIQIANDIEHHSFTDNVRFQSIEKKLDHIEDGLDDAVKQLNRNTGSIEANKEKIR